MSGENTEVKDPVEEVFVRNDITPDQAAAIAKVKEILELYWKL